MQIHERMESMVDVYVAGGLSAAERVEVDQHIAGCTACAALLRDAREFSTWAKGASIIWPLRRWRFASRSYLWEEAWN